MPLVGRDVSNGKFQTLQVADNVWQTQLEEYADDSNYVVNNDDDVFDNLYRIAAFKDLYSANDYNVRIMRLKLLVKITVLSPNQ